MASLTKLMTALLVLEEGAGTPGPHDQGPSRRGLRSERLRRGIDPRTPIGRGRVRPRPARRTAARFGERRRRSPRDRRRGQRLGLRATHERTREEPGDVSNEVRLPARARRPRSLVRRRPRAAAPGGVANTTPSATWSVAGSRVVRSNSARPRRIQNRNVLLWLYEGASGVKTGFTAGSGFCLVATARRGDRELAVVLLGGRDEVFSDAAALLNHGFAAYERRALVGEGEPLGSVRVRGGEVPVVAGAGLDALVSGRGERRDRADPQDRRPERRTRRRAAPSWARSG